MKKRIYMAPAIKTRKIEYTLMAASSPKESEYQKINVHPDQDGGDPLSKENNSAWSSEED